MSGNQNIQKSSITATLTANTVDLAILTNPCFEVTVVNVTGTAAIYFTVGHPGGPCPQPTVGGQECYVLPAAVGSVDIRHAGQFGTVVQLISSGTPTYTVSITGAGG